MIPEQLAFDLVQPEPMKKCSRCATVWPLAIYHNKRSAKDGKQDQCPSCRAASNLKTNREAADRKKRERRHEVYFIQQGDTDWWKIGKATNKKDRRSELQCGNPHELHVVDSDTGYDSVEFMWHQVFARRRGRGEWFYFGPEEYIIQEATPTTPIVIWEPE